MRSRLAAVVSLVVALAAAGSVGWSARHAAVTPPAPPRLAVLISVDQMRFDYLERFRPLFTGGLRTFVTRGAVFTNARYRHACSETGPGHATLLTGRSPRSSGIVGNGWYDRTLRRRVTVVEDETVRLTDGAEGPPPRPRTSWASRSGTCSRPARRAPVSCRSRSRTVPRS
jgi:predicted AlkP superfamily pyrophosphatase or phosphodiesterase